MVGILLSIYLLCVQVGPPVPGGADSPELLATIGKNGTAPGEFLSPGALILDERGTLYVADVGNNRIQAFDSLGKYLREITGEGIFQGLTGIGVSGTTGLVISDLPGRKLTRVDRYGVSLGDLYNPAGTLFLPQGMAVARSGDIVVCEGGSHHILIFSGSGDLLRSFGGFGAGPGNLSDPAGIAVREADQTVWVADQGNNRVQSFSYWGEPLAILGKGKLKAPTSVSPDGKGKIWVADSGNDRVVAFSKEGAELVEIKGLARPGFVLCSGGKLYVSDTGNHRVLIYGLESP